jgi:hypothetical protein
MLTNCAQKNHLIQMKSKEKKDEMPRVERATKEQQRERERERETKRQRDGQRERDGKESE